MSTNQSSHSVYPPSGRLVSRTGISPVHSESLLQSILDRDPGWLQDLLTIVAIFIAGLIAGALGWAFGSQVSGSAGDYKLTGFVAGAGFTWAAFGSLFQSLRKSSRAHEESRANSERVLDDLRRRNEELRQKLIRSAPCPQGFDISLDEHQKLILARPAEWEPQGGVIFDFKAPPSSTDLVPAEFRVYYYPVSSDVDPEAHYAEVCRTFQSDRRFRDVTPQRVHVGGEPAPIESLQLLIRGYVAVSVVDDPHTRQRQNKYRFIDKDEFDEHVALRPARAGAMDTANASTDEDPKSADCDPTREWADEVVLIIVRCWHKQLRRVYSFDLFDNMLDINASTSKFNRALQSVRFLD